MKTHPSIEPLEARIAPAALSAIADGVLTITGDDLANAFTVTEQATPGAYQIAGVDAGQETNFTGVTSIVINFAGGVDTLTFNGDATAGTELKKDLKLNSTGQLNATMNNNVNLLGTLAVTHSGAQSLTLNFNGAGSSVGAISAKDGEGNSSLNFNSMRIVKGVTVDGGAGGNDTLNLSSTIVGGAVNLTSTGAGIDQLVVTGAFVGGALSFSTEGTNPTFAIQLGSAVKGPVAAKFFGSGISATNVVAGSLIFGKFTVTGGASNDLVQIGQASVLGPVSLSLGEGNNSLTLDEARVGGKVGFTSGTGNATVKIQNSAEIHGGVTVNAAQAAVGDFDFNDSLVTGALKLTSGAGSDTFDASNFTLTGGLSAALGGGVNTVNLTGLTAASATFTTGDGLDTINGADLHLLGALVAKLGAGQSTLNLAGGSLGALTVATLGGNGSFSLVDLFIRGKTSFKTGAGNDTLQIANMRFGALAFDAGGGTNNMNVEQSLGSNDTVNTIFGGAVSYKGGDGIDTVVLGLDATDRATFLAVAKFNGGAGANTLNDDFAVTVFPLAVSNFTVV